MKFTNLSLFTSRKLFRGKLARSVLSVLTIIVATQVLWQFYLFSVEWHFFKNHYLAYQFINHEKNNSQACPIPLPNPFDAAVMSYVKNLNPFYCRQVQPYLTYVTSNGTLVINSTAVKVSRLDPSQLECSFQTFQRKEKDDDKLSYDNEQLLYSQIDLPEGKEFVNVTCIYERNIIYRGYHTHIIRKTPAKCTKGKHLKPSVFIFVIESLSRLNAVRHMPKTYSYITKILQSQVLKGLNKVADNSFPNMIPFLTGCKVYTDPSELPGDQSTGPFDDWPFVWKNFSNAGYITALHEDDPEFTLLNYLSKGCLNQPTDFYLRPLWLALHGSPLWKESSQWCFGNVPKLKLMLDWILDFCKKHKSIPYFLFSFFIEVTHNDFNNAQLLDDDVSQFLEMLNRSGLFKNTIVILMGDHGNRYGNVLETEVGRIEERMPFFSIHLPSTLKKQYPHLQKYLKMNSERLTTWIDIHSLLMDVATETYFESAPQHVWNTRGYSPWRMLIPSNRTCEEAGIPQQFCICQQFYNIPVDDPTSKQVADAFVIELNSMLEPVSMACAKLWLNRIIQGQVIIPNKHVAQKKGYILAVRILVEVGPSRALLEGILQRDAWSSKYSVVGDINRLNKYKGQSECVNDKKLRKFCYCFSNIVS
ncbi:uncharacterized protein LOC143227493 [Tachypleus tridentatus]|uniref:uncharacterized protein LOC143227493 n=1 Tax=Tachypleus tridentatus TaxID=6853 RepID=UPI003FCFA665